MSQSPQVSYLLSFLGILVHRAGGEIVIDRLSDYAGSNLQLSMKIEGDHVTLQLNGGPTQRAADVATVCPHGLPLGVCTLCEVGRFIPPHR